MPDSFATSTAQMTWDSLDPTMMELLRPAAVLNKVFEKYLCAIVPFSSTAPMTWDSLGPRMMELLRHATALNKMFKKYMQ